MRNIEYLSILLILFSCKKEDETNTIPAKLEGYPILITQTEDLNIITCVEKGSLWNFSIIKTDTIGNKIWEKQYSSNDELHLKKIISINNSGFIIALNQRANYSGIADDYVRLICYENNGTIKWEMDIDFSEHITFSDICLMDNNSYMVCGNFESYSKFYYGKIDENGNLEWIKTYSDSLQYSQVNQILFINDSINILGALNSDKAPSIKSDKTGNIFNQIETPISSNYFCFSENSSELLLTDIFNDGGLQLNKIDSEGNLIWQAFYQIPNCDYTILIDLIITDNSYIILGSKNYNGIGEPNITRYFVMKTLFNGNEVWQKKLKDEDHIICCINELYSENIIAAVLNSKDINTNGVTFYLEILKN